MPSHPLAPALTPDQLLAVARARYTTKAFDPTAPALPEATVDALLELLRLAPSSVNSQPWHFLVAGTPEARARVARATHDRFAYNTPKLEHCSHVLVFCTRQSLDTPHTDALLAQEAADGRFADAAAQAATARTRSSFIEPHRQAQSLPQWIERQVYLALGTLLLGAATLGVDATPIEGFDSTVLDTELGLPEKGLSSLVLVALGTRGEADFNARLPKSRLPAAAVVTRL